MKNSIIISILFFLINSLSFAQPDTLWTKTFGGSNSEGGHSVQQTGDDGYIIAGSTLSYGAGGYDVYLIKTDASGNQQWYRTFGGTNWDIGYSVQQTTDGGYIITGETQSYGAGNFDVWLIKTNASGNQQWSRTFGGNSIDCGWSVQQTRDSGYIITGATQSYGAGYDDVYLIKTDASGNQQWSRTFGGSLYDWCMSVQQTNDGGYIIVGSTQSYGAGSYDVYLIKTDASGNQQWSQTFGGSSGDYGYSVQQTRDGGYIIAARTQSYGAGSYDVYLIKTDASGDTAWTKTFGGSYGDEGYSVQQTGDGGYIILGYTNSFGAGWYDVYLIKTDAGGNQQWSQTFGGNYDDQGRNLQQTSEGGYIIVGYTDSYGAGLSDVYLIRLESETPPMVNLTLTPHNFPIQIPSGGGSFQFDLDIVNNSLNTINADIWTDITLPGGAHYQIISKPNRNIPPGAVISVDNLTQMVPGTALPGNYAYNGYIRDHNTWQILAEDSFPFTKLPGNDAPVHNLGWALLGWDDDIFGAEIQPSSFIIHHSVNPNPFNPSTVISFELCDASFMKLVVYDITGREVARLVDGFKPAGLHQVIFDGSDFASGIYFAKITAGNFSQTTKMLLVK